ncbi:MAG: AMP-binding protein [Actinobacteria bacterium]|nr:AMP-binding protein [Actinomycetota bacterium]
MAGTAGERWELRDTAPDVASEYLRAGWWDDRTLGQVAQTGLSERATVAFEVHSKFRPWKGTFADLDRGARQLAGALRAQGVGAGDVVVLQMPNWVEAGYAFFAAIYLGAVVVPIVHFYGAKEVGYILRAVRPDVVVSVDRFGHADHLTLYDGLLNGDIDIDPLWLVVGDTDADALPQKATPLVSLMDGVPVEGPAPVDPDGPALIGFTSGTTRDPKGVVHSHRTMGCEVRQLDYMFPHGGPPGITAAPVGHFIGMLNAFLTPLLRERPVHMVDVWDPAEVLRLMKDEGLGMGGGATYFLTSLLDHPDFEDAHLAMMPFAGLGGSPIPVAVTERATRMGIDVFRSYGSTEHPSITGCLLHEPLEKRVATDGRPMPGVEIKLDEAGEILSRGPDCFVGYTDAELTKRVFDADGWYRTGDVGVLDADGYLTITDRVSDIIIRGGENISAQEVEELLMQLDGIAEVCVVAEPDDRRGERAAAVVRPKPDRAAPTVEDMRVHLDAAGLARQKWPESVYEVAELPRTPSGKVQKYVLRRQLREGSLK